MKTIPILRTTRDLANISSPFLVPNGGNTVRALQAAIADAIMGRRELARWRAVGRGYVRGTASNWWGPSLNVAALLLI